MKTVVEEPVVRPEKSWLVRRFASILRRSPTEAEDITLLKKPQIHRPHEDCAKCREAFDKTVQLWVNEDECSVDPTNVYRQQLRVILQKENEETDLEFYDTDTGQLTRSLSETDLGRLNEANGNDIIEDLMDRYGLMTTDYVETLCVPDGTIIGDDECYITGAFLDSLDQSSTKSLSSRNSTELSSPVAFRTAVEESRRTVSLNAADTKEEEEILTTTAPAVEPVNRNRSFPQRKRNMSTLLFDRLTRRLSKANCDYKWRNDPLKAFVERALCNCNEGLPDHLSALSQTNDINDVETVSLDSTEAAKYNLNSPLWDRFDLFSKEEYTSWHDKFRHDKMSSKMVKKQDAIFELILIEKAHCAHLAFLQQGYRNRLIQENILPESDVNRLIPDVLDALLVFHLHLLDRLTARQRESDEVETISDILAEEMSDEGKHVSIAINAYTTFGSAKEKSEKMFESLMAKNGRFADFIRVIV
ncbi:hypothetical protein OESDEN_04873 [Oesophagostomum dentatum]|uniref:DH domain-containing protein n=1 Tax=Oesophagostomum dentatum TaxID=61180 RepID=A0A0B1TGI3_OESDE|nr:hypothetical protein OESDEN_04873 [Oesophagostomum dentatum]